MQPKQITASQLEAFITSKEVCVIRITPSPGFQFNKYLDEQLKALYPGRTDTACLALKPLDHKKAVVKTFLSEWLPKIGLSGAKSIFPGYYLFRDGILLAYHPGTIDPNKMDAGVQKITLWGGGISAILVGLIERNALKGLQTFVEAMELPAGLKVFEFFKETLRSHTFNYSQQQHQQKIVEDELTKAYKLLNILPTATDDEVKTARNKAIKAAHPDKNPAEAEIRNKLSTEINNAYDLIQKSRKNAKSSVG